MWNSQWGGGWNCDSPHALPQGVLRYKCCSCCNPTRFWSCSTGQPSCLWVQEPRGWSVQQGAGRTVAAAGLSPLWVGSICLRNSLSFTLHSTRHQKHNIAVLTGLEPRPQSVPVQCACHSTSTRDWLQRAVLPKHVGRNPYRPSMCAWLYWAVGHWHIG